MSGYEVRYLDESEFGKWDAFVEASEQGNIYSKSFWLRAISKAVSADFRIVSVLCDRQIKAGIGLVIKDNLYGKVIRQPPLTPYTSIVLPDLSGKSLSTRITEYLNLMSALAAHLEDRYYSYVSLINMPAIKDMRAFIWRGWRATPNYTYVVSLADLDKLYSSFSKSLRRRIERCAETTALRLYSEDNIEKFLPLYELTFKRQAMDNPLGTDKLRDLYCSIRDHKCVKIYFAELKDGTPISSEIILYSNKGLVYSWTAGANPEYYKTGAISYLLWYMFQDLHKEGVKYYDFMGANVERIEQFKRAFGGELIPYFSVSRANSRLLRFCKALKELN